MNQIDDDLNRIEDVLRSSLRRQDAPPGFADRVLVRVSQPALKPRPWLRLFPHPLVRWTALAAFATAMIVSVHVHNVRQREGEAAKQRPMLALRIASSKLQLARGKVNEINADQTNDNRTNDREVKE